MGADMCLTMVAHRDGAEINVDAGLEYIKNLRVSDLEKIISSDFAFEDFDTSLPESLKGVKDVLSTTLLGVVNSLNARDVATYKICGFVCYFTGGMTWGDDPSDSFTDFNRIGECGVLGEEVMLAAGFSWPPTGPDTFHINEQESPADV